MSKNNPFDDLAKLLTEQEGPEEPSGSSDFDIAALNELAELMKDEKPKTSGPMNVLKGVGSGLLNMGAGILKAVPETVGIMYDTAAVEQNMLRNRMGLKPIQYADIADHPANPLNYVNKGAQGMYGMAQQIGPRYERGIIEEAARGNWGQAFEQTLVELAQTVPQYGLAAASVLTGNPAAGLTLMGASAGGQKKLQLEEQYPGMPVADQRVNAFLTGAFETAMERLVTIPGLEDALTNPAVRQAVWKKIFNVFYNAGKEGLSEGATQVAENVVDMGTGILEPTWANLRQGSGEATLIGSLAGGITSGAGAVRQTTPRLQQGPQQQPQPLQQPQREQPQIPAPAPAQQAAFEAMVQATQRQAQVPQPQFPAPKMQTPQAPQVQDIGIPSVQPESAQIPDVSIPIPEAVQAPESVLQVPKQVIPEPPVVQPPTNASPSQTTGASQPAGQVSEPTQVPLVNPVQAKHLKLLANSLQSKIDAKRNPAIAGQNPTPRRAGIIASMGREADAMERLQQKMLKVADAIEANQLPPSLRNLAQKSQFEELEQVLRSSQTRRLQEEQAKGKQVDWSKRESYSPEDIQYANMLPSINRYNLRELLEWTKGKKGSVAHRKLLEPLILSNGSVVGLSEKQTVALDTLLKLAKDHSKDSSFKRLKDELAGYNRLKKIGANSTEELHQILNDYLTVTRGVKTQAPDPIKEAERKLIGTKIPGYFPTPESVVQKMIDAAEVEQGHKVLEPSAGKGNIADMFKEHKPDVIEYDATLRDILKAKGHNVVGNDFLQHTGQYDRIVMNPPFENGQDIDHVRRAYELLKPGGRVVSIMSEGPFFRQSKKDTDFRGWLEGVGGTSEQLPDGSFKSSERPTGVATRMVVIDKPGTTDSFKGKPVPKNDAYLSLKGQIEEKYKSPSPTGATKFADVGGYADKSAYAAVPTEKKNTGLQAVELPELVEVAKSLLNGKTPAIDEKLKALGRFRFNEAQGAISLHPDIFLGQQIDSTTVKAMDVPKALKALKAKHPGNDVVIKQQYNKGKGTVELKAIRKDPAVAAKVLAHEIGHVVDWLPDGTVKRGNILGHIASLKKYMKGMIDALPPGQPVSGLLPGSPQINRKTVMAELKKLSQTWKPFDPSADAKFTKYRHSNEELYADAISVLFNEPALLQEAAPQFYSAFMGYLNRKPQVKAIYNEIQDRLQNRELVNEKRLADIVNMFNKDSEIRNRLHQEQQPKVEKVIDTLTKWFVDKDHPVLQHVRAAEKEGGAAADIARNARYALEETKYISSEVENYLYEFSSQILQSLEEGDLSIDALGTYLFLQRVQNERDTLANPLGQTKATAAETMNAFRSKIGDARFRKVAEIAQRYRSIREQLILPRIAQARMYSPDLMQAIEESKDYAKFSVLHYLENKFGKGETARVYKQVGTLSEISNPAVATVLQDISMLRAAKINEAKTATVVLLQQAASESIQEAETYFSQDRQGMIAKVPHDPRKGMLTVMVDGKPQSYYVSRDVAEMFEYKPFEAIKIAHLVGNLLQIQRDVYVSKNPIWMVRNVIRDFQASVKNLPEVSLTKVPALAKKYKEAYREAWCAVMHQERSEDISTMMKGYMLTADRAYQGRERNFENEIQRLVEEFSLDPISNKKAPGAWRRLNDFIDRVGRVSELGGKVAGYKFLKEFSSRSEKEIAHIVRTRVGTPDYKRQGSLQSYTNNICLFSNVNKEGLRSTWESYRDDPGAYIFKTVAVNVVPKLILLAAGTLGPDLLKEIIGGMTNYDKQTYHIVPLGLTKEGKSVYLRIPQDYEGQLWSRLTWSLAQGRILGQGGAIDAIVQHLPYHLNPYILIGKEWYDYGVRGLNPQDDFRGRSIIPYSIYKKGGPPATWEMAKHTMKDLGLSTFWDPSNPGQYADTTFEKMLTYFPFNLLGSFLRITDYGHIEQEENRKK